MSVVFSRGENPLRADKLNEAFDEKLDKTGGELTGPLILSGVPVSIDEAVTKQYVDTQISGIATSIPTPSPTTLGGVFSAAAQSNKWISSIGTDGRPILTQPTASDVTGLGGRLSSNITPVSLPGAVTSEQDLQTYTLPAGTLASNGQALRIKAIGSFAIHAGATRTLRLYFGATSVGVISTAGTAGVVEWAIEVYVWRLTGTTQIAQAFGPFGPTNANVTASASTQATPGETLSGPVTIKTTGQTTAAQAADIVSSVLMVELLS